MMRIKRRKDNFFKITETPGQKASREQLSRIYSRYHFAKQYASGKDVLDVGCGSGIGLSYLAETARSVVGIDIDEKNIKMAQDLASGNTKVKVALSDAHCLGFKNDSFDMVLLFEAIYYLDRPELFLKEAHRILREGGILMISSVNKDWRDFHPSIYARKYFSTKELYLLLSDWFSFVELYGDFPADYEGGRDRFVSFLKRLASKMHIIPGSLTAREKLKRLFFGELSEIPKELSCGMADYAEPVKLEQNQVTNGYKIIYAVARKSCGKDYGL
ncbi:MAG: class I SAM-dependent methyltransferase [Actinobacteria bacterium]|nr:class I SAM-dependent methyltransferase [Actinomycetota bacterium]